MVHQTGSSQAKEEGSLSVNFASEEEPLNFVGFEGGAYIVLGVEEAKALAWLSSFAFSTT